MPRYIVKWDYIAGELRYTAGSVVELTAEFAAWVQRDSRGVLELIVERPLQPEPEPERERAERAMEAPAADRMVRKAGGKRKR